MLHCWTTLVWVSFWGLPIYNHFHFFSISLYILSQICIIRKVECLVVWALAFLLSFSSPISWEGYSLGVTWVNTIWCINVSRCSLSLMGVYVEQDGWVVRKPAFVSKGPRFDPNSILCSCYSGGSNSYYTYKVMKFIFIVCCPVFQMYLGPESID